LCISFKPGRHFEPESRTNLVIHQTSGLLVFLGVTKPQVNRSSAGLAPGNLSQKCPSRGTSVSGSQKSWGYGSTKFRGYGEEILGLRSRNLGVLILCDLHESSRSSGCPSASRRTFGIGVIRISHPRLFTASFSANFQELVSSVDSFSLMASTSANF
jgi:hypothetical protein